MGTSHSKKANKLTYSQGRHEIKPTKRRSQKHRLISNHQLSRPPSNISYEPDRVPRYTAKSCQNLYKPAPSFFSSDASIEQQQFLTHSIYLPGENANYRPTRSKVRRTKRSSAASRSSDIEMGHEEEFTNKYGVFPSVEELIDASEYYMPREPDGAVLNDNRGYFRDLEARRTEIPSSAAYSDALDNVAETAADTLLLAESGDASLVRTGQYNQRRRQRRLQQYVHARGTPTTYYSNNHQNNLYSQQDKVNFNSVYKHEPAGERGNKFLSSSINNAADTMASPLSASRQLSREVLMNVETRGFWRHQTRLAKQTSGDHHKRSQSSTSQYSSQSSCSLYTQPQFQQDHHQVKLLPSQIANRQQSNLPVDYHYEQMFQHARHQRGLAYSEADRKRLGLLGLIPAAVQDQELQERVVINFIDNCNDELSKYNYLRHLKDFNERLFYSTLTKHVEKLMPIVYTPTVGLACQHYSEIYMRPRGIFISANDAGRVGSLLANWPDKDVRVIVVTDGERILGLGDLGANGMGICVGKLSLYTALAGIPPQNVLPVTIDVGTNNETLLRDPFYIGLKQKRVRGEKYDALIGEFMEAAVNRWGRSCLIQFEDFANMTAFKILQEYRNKFCTFNDDIQGTASVCLSGLLSASKQVGCRLDDCSFLFFGAGEANLGTAGLLLMAMMEEGVSGGYEEARRRIWLVDSKGLVVSSRDDLSDHKRSFAQDAPKIEKLEDIVEYTKPIGIIGASAQGGAFTENVCRKMAALNERPIIFALSNPTSKAECTAKDAYSWTDGRCIFASGSPFDPVVHNGRTHVIGQGNNAYIFPAVGLAAIASHIHTIPEDTFLVAARALSDQLTDSDASVGLVYPRLSKIREVTLRVATRVLEHFYSERLATYRPEPDDKRGFLESIQFNYNYQGD